jgi:hypothetical protein
MIRIPACFALFLLLAPSASRAQRPPAIITGRVMILDSMRPAAQALVRIESLNVYVLTDSAGDYRLVIPAARITDGDSVQITASRVGLIPQRQWISLAAGDRMMLEFAGKTQALAENQLCYDLVFGVTGRGISDRATVEKLCRLTVLHDARFPRDRPPPP